MKLKIGEIAKLCNVSNRMLRHYEEIGLLMPSIVDDFTGYRYYGVKEIRELFFILRLKEQGFSLKDIQELFEEGTYVSDINRLEFYLNKCKKELELLSKRYNCLKLLIEQHKNTESYTALFFEKLPSIIVASYTMSISNDIEMKEHLLYEFGPELHRLRCRLPYPYIVLLWKRGKYQRKEKLKLNIVIRCLKWERIPILSSSRDFRNIRWQSV